MKYEQCGESVILNDIADFDVGLTLESGQCFRFKKINDNEYDIVVFGKVLNIRQGRDSVVFTPCTLNEFESIWLDYFDLRTDYGVIRSSMAADDVLRAAVEFAPGIRILNQDVWECLVSFIISQRSNIPKIKTVVENVSRMFGEDIGGGYYSFPSPSRLAEADVGALTECKAGYRTGYIIDAARKVLSGEIDLSTVDAIETDELRRIFMTVKGVGPKVADCVLTYSCRRREVFATDVWIGRIMRHFYFKNAEVPIKEIHELAYKKFGEYAAFAQQYLFHYAKSSNIK